MVPSVTTLKETTVLTRSIRTTVFFISICTAYRFGTALPFYTEKAADIRSPKPFSVYVPHTRFPATGNYSAPYMILNDGKTHNIMLTCLPPFSFVHLTFRVSFRPRFSYISDDTRLTIDFEPLPRNADADDSAYTLRSISAEHTKRFNPLHKSIRIDDTPEAPVTG